MLFERQQNIIQTRMGLKQTVEKQLLKQGKSFEEELAFVHYYHYDSVNLKLHVFSLPFQVLSAFIFPLSFLPTQLFLLLGNLLALLYTFVYSFWDLYVAIGMGAMVSLESILVSKLLSPESSPFSEEFSVTLFRGLGLLGVVLIAINVLVGHVMYQERLAAFDIWEFYVVGPFYFVYYGLRMLLNYRPQLHQTLDALTLKKYGECSSTKRADRKKNTNNNANNKKK